MTYLPTPGVDGVYRIKVLEQNLYIESITGSVPWLKLAPLSPSNNKQKWKLTRVPGQSSIFTIISVEDQYGVTYKKTEESYWGHGFPFPHYGPSQQWSILERTSEGKTFSKIKLKGDSDCFDSIDSTGANAVHFYPDSANRYTSPKQCYVFELLPATTAALDIVFIQDATGSQQPYIDKSRDEIGQICTQLVNAGNFAPADLRFGLITFRDHSPQDDSFLTQSYPFTSDFSLVQTNLAAVVATGGGDGPEAQSDALADALAVEWRDDATKVVVLITDSPPHGIGESNDGFPNGCPLQTDPLRSATRMGDFGITLFVIACEPALSQEYTRTLDFYIGLTGKTGGKVYPLGQGEALYDRIIGGISETIDAEALVAKYQNDIRIQANTQNLNAKDISKILHRDLAGAGVQHNTFEIEDIYESDEQGHRNAQIWLNADKLEDARPNIQPVQGNRIKERYLSGGQLSLSTTLKKQPISLAQVEGVVRKSLMRG